jgi:hypothetical protein
LHASAQAPREEVSFDKNGKAELWSNVFIDSTIEGRVAELLEGFSGCLLLILGK